VLVSNDLRRALDAGVDDIAHMVWDNLPVDLIDRMIANGVIWVPTIELGQNVGYNLGDAAINNLRKFVQAGGIVALGTDYAGYNRPFQLGMPINEIFWMLDAGMTPMQVIVSATRNAAIVCNRGDDLGTLEAGKIADVLIVNGNPLEDIQSLTNVRMVIHNGVVIMDENQ
jgi:imidazolonepropionase-like amidohydrolase